MADPSVWPNPAPVEKPIEPATPALATPTGSSVADCVEMQYRRDLVLSTTLRVEVIVHADEGDLVDARVHLARSNNGPEVR